MKRKLLRKFGGFVATAAVTLFLVGCNGKAGHDGATGATGATGANGANGSPIAANAINASLLTTDQWSKLVIQGEIIETPTVTATAGAPVVKFRLHDPNGNPIIGMGRWTTQSSSALVASMPNIAFSIAKLVPGTNGSPSRWYNYIITSVPTKSSNTANLGDQTKWFLTTPSTDSYAPNLVDNLDGTYQYTFQRDITKTIAAYNASVDSGSKLKADLGGVSDLTFDATAIHRLTIQVGGSARNTGGPATHDANTADGTDSGVPAVHTDTAANIIADFKPGGAAIAATETRDIVATNSCNACHTKLGTTFHNNTRVDTRYCVICHTEQRKYGQTDVAFSADYSTASATSEVGKIAGQAQGYFPTFIHRLHMGEELTAAGYSYAGLAFDTRYPQGKSCTTCHSSTAAGQTVATAQGDNWMNNPSRFVCGACHDNIDWSVAHNGSGNIEATDANCKQCHLQTGTPNYYDVRVAHQRNEVTVHNPTTPTGISNFTYNITSATLDSNRNLNVTFQMFKDGVAISSLSPVGTKNNAVSGAVVLDPDARPLTAFPGYIGGPSIYINYALPQDGILAPADYNASLSVTLPSLLVASGSPKTGTINLTADSNNAFTAVITGDTLGQQASWTGWVSPATPVATFAGVKKTPLAIPIGASLITVSMRGAFTQVDFTGMDSTLAVKYGPYDKADPSSYSTTLWGGTVAKPATKPQTGGLLRVGPMVQLPLDPTSVRRAVIDNNKCNACHDQLGTQPNFHGGATALISGGGALGAGSSTNGNECNVCHVANRTSSGWAVAASNFVHAIHGVDNRTNTFTWHGTAASNYGMMTYPAVLNNCEQCHLPGTYDFTAASSAAALPNLLWSSVAASSLTYDPFQTTVTNGVPFYNTVSPYIVPTATLTVVSTGTTTPNPRNTWVGSYGSAYSATTDSGTAPNITTNLTPTAAAGTVLVNSPITSACASCHDSPAAIAHFKSTGGTFYEPRSSTPLVTPASPTAKTEACLTCHGSGKLMDIKEVHKVSSYN
jgi:OmcA/MtrC family decaheme c-type cytochrome